ncbi:MAG: sulfite exporter TauE/SafE family protein [Acidobacteria bacterium]|nr:sulfite exporter TauE/SafE family protein [Acidobacteriota bacterium]
MGIWQYALLLFVGLGAGIVNVLAGGGSFLTIPLMMFLGLPPATANGTNRIALLAQNIMAVSEFKRRGFSDFRLSLTLALCTIPGAVAGAVAAVYFDPTWFKRIFAILMIVMLPMVLGGARKARKRRSPHGKLLAHLGAVALGFYGGFIQAGTGPLLIFLLVSTLALDLVRVNMHKVFIIGFYMVPSLLVFALSGDIDWIAGLILAAGTTTGAVLGTRLAVEGGERVIRIFLVVAVIVIAIRLLLSA